MRKKLFLILMICVVTSSMFGQNQRSVSLIEFELGLGVKASTNVSATDLSSLSTIKSDKTKMGAAFLMEARVNIPTTAFDVGLQLSRHYFDREWEDLMDQTYRFTSLTTYVDYNYRKWNNIVPFAGIGIGFSYIDLEYDYINSIGSNTNYIRSACFNPRIGVEFYNRIRLTCDWRLMDKNLSHIGLSLGFVFGGGKK